MGLEGFKGDLCLCLDFGAKPRAMQLLKLRVSWVTPGLQQEPGIKSKFRCQFGTYIWRELLLSHWSQPARMFLGRC